MIAVVALAQNPFGKELETALVDARKVFAADIANGTTYASRTRYWSLFMVPEANLTETVTVLNYWANSLSREAEFVKIRRVSATVYAVNIDDYQWDNAVYEKLADIDPYFHVQLQIAPGQAYKAFFPASTDTKAGWYDAAVVDKPHRVAALAPWLPANAAAELVAITQSKTPIIAGDWWLQTTAIQAGRDGVGYYDWLGIKDKTTFNRVVGFDLKESQRVKREVAAIVARSGVGYFPRQIFRFQSITGGYWETRDALDDNKNERNAIRQLDGDYKHQAEEIYGVLPNGLFAYFLGDDKGVRQDSAPDKISSDDTAPGRDRRIHNGLSCVRCHVEGLRPINDWARRVFANTVSLNVVGDEAKARRLRQLYLGELQEKLADDAAAYAKSLNKLTGMKPSEMAKAMGGVWERKVERDLLPADTAKIFGLDEKTYLERLRTSFRANRLSDIVLASHIADPPIAIRDDDFEQLMPLVAPIVLQVQRGK